MIYLKDFFEFFKIPILLFIFFQCIFFCFRCFNRLFGYYDCSLFSNIFEYISEKIQDISKNPQDTNPEKTDKNKSLYYDTEEIDKPYKINLSKDKSGNQF